MNITITDTAMPRIRQLAAACGGNRVAELHAEIGHEVQRLTYDHLRAYASSHHATAARLGATPSNHLAQAAEKVASPAALKADADGAVLTINHPGIIRALRDVTILPREAKSLAIPVHRLAYNRRPRQIWDALKLFIPKGKNVICFSEGGKITALYVLVRSVTQKQDRSMLPSDADWRKAARVAALKFIEKL